MILREELARVTLAIIESAGYLKPAARADASLIPNLEDAIQGRLTQQRESLIGFIEWWGEHGHEDHINTTLALKWRQCQHPLCVSLLRTLRDLIPPINADAAHAAP